MPSASYDLIVLGNELSGLVAATLCAKRGLRVLILQAEEVTQRYQVGSFTLPVAPRPLAGLSGVPVQRVVDELHFQHLIRRKLVESRPSLQFVLPDARIDVDADSVHLAREVTRELDDDRVPEWLEATTALSELLDAALDRDVGLAATGFWEKRELSRLASRFESDATRWAEQCPGPVAEALVATPAVLGAQSSWEHLGPEAKARCFAQWRRGLPRLAGDRATLREIFVDKFASHNGEVRSGIAEELTTGWGGKVTGVRLSSGEDLGASHVIAAMPISELVPLFGSKPPKRIRQLADSVQVGGYHYTLNLVVDEVAIPEGMAASVVLVTDPQKPLTGANAIALYIDPPDDRARVLVSACAVCPAPAGGQIDDAFANLRVAMRENLETVMPFFSSHVILAHSPVESAPAEGSEGRGVDAELFESEPVWSLSGPRTMGVDGLPCNTGIKQLSLASTQVLPGLGLESDFATGWAAAAHACTSAGKRKDYLKDETLSSAGN